jgi:PleD family two-component response regulator
VAARDDKTPDIDALIKRAEEVVYQEKQRGRNYVATIQSPK